MLWNTVVLKKLIGVLCPTKRVSLPMKTSLQEQEKHGYKDQEYLSMRVYIIIHSMIEQPSQ